MRNASVDLLRGVCIFVIVWSHVSLGVLLDEIVNPIILGVFFLLSGMFYRTMSLSELIRVKCKRLVVPWLIFVVIGYVYHWLYSFVDSRPFDYAMLAEDLYTGGDYRANVPCWFLIGLLEIMLVYNVVERYVKSQNMRLFVLLLMSVLGNSLLCMGYNHFYIGKSLFYLSLFGIGDMYMKRPVVVSYVGGGTMIVVTSLLVLLKVCLISSQFIDYCIGWLCAVCMTVAFLSLCSKLRMNAVYDLICSLGRNSLVVLCFHILAIDFVWRILYPVFGTPDVLVSFLYAVIVTALCVPVIFVFNLFVRHRL